MSEEQVTQIQIRGGQGYLLNAPSDVLPAIRKATSFRPVGFQYSPKFKRWVGTGDSRRRQWDGYVKLLKHSKFPAGLLSTVTDVLDAHDVPYQVTKEPIPDLPEVPISSIRIDSRGYQDRAVEAALLNPRGSIRAPTGAGKTAIGARIIEAHKRRSLVIVPTIDLLYQYKEFLQEHLIIPGHVGQLGDGMVDPQEVTVATVRTAAKAMSVAYETYEYAEYDDKDNTEVNPAKLRDWISGIGTLIVDEAHILGAEVVYDVVTKMNAPNKFGMSASPWRDDGADLMITAAVGGQIFEIPTEELVDLGYLVPPVIEVISTEGMWTPAPWQKNEFAKCYKHEIVENPIRNQLIAEKANGFDTPTLILVKQVNHGRMLEPLIEDSIFLSGKDTGARRQEVFNDLRAGKVKRIIATTIADMGLDLPICQNLVLAGGGKSSTRHLQRIGRVVRPYEGKKFARVIDFDDTHVHKWFKQHAAARRKIEKAEWENVAIWL